MWFASGRAFTSQLHLLRPPWRLAAETERHVLGVRFSFRPRLTASDRKNSFRQLVKGEVIFKFIIRIKNNRETVK